MISHINFFGFLRGIISLVLYPLVSYFGFLGVAF